MTPGRARAGLQRSSIARPGCPIFLLGLLAALLAGGGCGTAPIKPGGTVAVALDGAKKKGGITVPLAHELVLTMPPAPPGHAWYIALHDTRYLKQTTDFVPARTPGEGPAITFLASNVGATKLRFLLAPVAQGAAVNPIDQYEVLVRIQ